MQLQVLIQLKKNDGILDVGAGDRSFVVYFSHTILRMTSCRLILKKSKDFQLWGTGIESCRVLFSCNPKHDNELQLKVQYSLKKCKD